jgi:hypothetical protein
MAALTWKDAGAVDGRSPTYHEHEARTAAAVYRIAPALTFKDGAFRGYLVQIDGGRVLGEKIMSIEDAKALAQKDYDGGLYPGDSSHGVTTG